MKSSSAFLASGAGWGVADAIWTLAPDAGSALAVLRGSVPTWAFLGPFALHLMAVREDSVRPRLPALLPWAYGLAALFALVSIWVPMHSAMIPVAWGWAYRPTAFYAAWWSFTVGCAGLGYGILQRTIAAQHTEPHKQAAHRKHGRKGAVAVTLYAISLPLAAAGWVRTALVLYLLVALSYLVPERKFELF